MSCRGIGADRESVCVCVEATSEADTSKRAELRGEQRVKQEVKTSQKEKKDRTRVTADVE
jgi:hypothetical protein